MPGWLVFVSISMLSGYSLLLLAAILLDLTRLIDRMWYRRLYRLVAHFFDAHLFRVTCFLLLAVCLLAVGREAASERPDLGRLLTLIVPSLILALGCQYGQVFFSRLKKLGPLELSEREVPELLAFLDEVFDQLDVEIDPQHLVGEPLSSEQKYALQRADLYLTVVELQGTEALPRSDIRRLQNKVFKVGSMALKLEEWLMARNRLSWCCRLLSGLKEETPASVFYNLGMAYFMDGQKRSEATKERHFREALRYFSAAAKADPRDSEAFFWMAFIEDELRMLDPAIQSNQKVLELRHGYAPAKFNIAISRIKKKEFEEALRQLRDISPEDESGMETLNFALTDPELQSLLDHPQCGKPAREFLEQYVSPS